MFRILETAGAAVLATGRFLRAYPLFCVFAAVVYLGAAAVTAKILPRYQVGGWLGAHVLTWAGTLPNTVLLAPVFAALYRFVILKDENRSLVAVDVRVRRVLVVGLVLSVLLMLGGMPFAASLDLVPGLRGRRMVAIGILLAALLAKLLVWWLAIRLAIAPPLAAAGTRPKPMDTAFAYTGGAVWRIVGVKLLIYLPLLLVVGTLMLLGRVGPIAQADPVLEMVTIVVITVVTACVEFVDAAAMALVATKLARAPTRKFKTHVAEDELHG